MLFCEVKKNGKVKIKSMTAKEPVSPHDIIFVSSTHVECIVLIKRAESRMK